MYGDLLLDQLGVKFLGPAPLDLELWHMLTTFHWNALGSSLGWWFCHNNTVSCNEKFWVEQVTVPQPPLGKDKGWGRTRGGGGTTILVMFEHEEVVKWSSFYSAHPKAGWGITQSHRLITRKWVGREVGIPLGTGIPNACNIRDPPDRGKTEGASHLHHCSKEE